MGFVAEITPVNRDLKLWQIDSKLGLKTSWGKWENNAVALCQLTTGYGPMYGTHFGGHYSVQMRFLSLRSGSRQKSHEGFQETPLLFLAVLCESSGIIEQKCQLPQIYFNCRIIIFSMYLVHII